MVNLLAMILSLLSTEKQSPFHLLSEQISSKLSRVTVLCNNLDVCLNGGTFDFPAIYKEIGSNGSLNVIPEAILLHITTDLKKSDLDYITWDATTKFLVYTDHNLINNVLEVLTAFQICHILSVSWNNGSYHIFNHDFKYCGSNLNTIESVEVDLSDLIKKDLFLQPSYENCTVNISYMNTPPFTIYSPGGRMGGHEGSNIRTLAEKFGFRPIYQNCNETGWAQLEQDVGAGNSLLGFGALYPFQTRNVFSDLLMVCYSESLSIFVPVGAGTANPTWFIILVSEFSSTVWIFTAFTFIVMNPISIILNKQNDISKVEWPFHNFALLLGVPQKMLQPKTITLTSSIFGYIMTTAYQAMMSSKLTAPAKIPDLETVEQLAASKLPMVGPITLLPILKSYGEEKDSPKSPAWAELAAIFGSMDLGSTAILNQMITTRNIAFLRHASNVYLLAGQNKKMLSNIHEMDDNLLRYVPATAVRKNACITSRLKLSLHRLCDCGVAQKWYHDLLAKRPNDDRIGPRKLSILDIKGFLLLLLFGWSLSISSFVIEVFIQKKMIIT